MVLVQRGRERGREGERRREGEELSALVPNAVRVLST